MVHRARCLFGGRPPARKALRPLAASAKDPAWRCRHFRLVSEKDSARIDFEARGISAVASASVHYFNTEAEIASMCRIALA